MAPSVVSMSTLYVLSLRSEEDLVDADGYVPRDRAAAKLSGQVGRMEGGLGQRHLSLTGSSLRLIVCQSLLGWEGRSPV